MIKTLERVFLISTLGLTATINAFAAGNFTAGKNKYDFSLEYEGTFKDNSFGKKNGTYSSDIEIDNDFGLTENQQLSFDIFLGKKATFSDELGGEQIQFDNGKWEQSFQARYRVNLNYSDNIAFGAQAGLGFFDNGAGEYDMRWTLRGMVRHDVKTGFYRHSRAELEYRRWFSKDITDSFRLDLRLKFNLAENVNFLIRQLTYMNFASNEYVNRVYPNGGNKNTNTYNLSNSFKISAYDIYAGPEFNTKVGMFYIYGSARIDGRNDTRIVDGEVKNITNRNHAKGFLVGYANTYDL